MDTIKGFLNRYAHIQAPQGVIRRIIAEVILKHTKVAISEKTIHVSRGIAHIHTQPIIKNAIFLKKEIILTEAQQALGKKDALHDIR